MENTSNIARSLSGDNAIFIIDVDKVIADFPRTGLTLAEVIGYLERGIFLNGDYYKLKDKKDVMAALLKNSK